MYYCSILFQKQNPSQQVCSLHCMDIFIPRSSIIELMFMYMCIINVIIICVHETIYSSTPNYTHSDYMIPQVHA